MINVFIRISNVTGAGRQHDLSSYMSYDIFFENLFLDMS